MQFYKYIYCLHSIKTQEQMNLSLPSIDDDHLPSLPSERVKPSENALELSRSDPTELSVKSADPTLNIKLTWTLLKSLIHRIWFLLANLYLVSLFIFYIFRYISLNIL